MRRQATVPFHLRKSSDVYSSTSITTTTERIHGLLRLDGDQVIIQWRLSRQTDHLGAASMHSTEELEAVQEVVLAVSSVSAAVVKRSRWNPWGGGRLVMRAADLRAFEGVAGQGGMKLQHPAEIVLRLRREDLLAAEEFAAELTLCLAEGAGAGDVPRVTGMSRPLLPDGPPPEESRDHQAGGEA